MEHCTIKGHLHKIGIVDDEFCRFCGAEEETPIHHCSCDVISVARARSFGWHKISLEDARGLDPLQILDFSKRLGY